MEGDKVALKPLNDCVLIDPEPFKSYEEQMGYTHIITPDKYKAGPIDPPIWGKVISKGRECTNSEITHGARILIGKWAGAKLKWEDMNLIIVKEKDVLAIDGR